MSLLYPCSGTSPTLWSARISIPQAQVNPWTLPLKHAHAPKSTFLLQQTHIYGQLCIQATCLGILLTGMGNKMQYYNVQAPDLYTVLYDRWSIKKKKLSKGKINNNKSAIKDGCAALQHLQIKRVLMRDGKNTHDATCNPFHVLCKLHVPPYTLQKLLCAWDILDFPMNKSKKFIKCSAC